MYYMIYIGLRCVQFSHFIKEFHKLYAVAARQGLVGLVDGLGLGPRDAVRAMSLFYAQESCPSAWECGA